MKNKLINACLCIIFAVLCITNCVFIINDNFCVANVKCKSFSLTTAKAMAVIEKDSGRLLYVHNENEKLPMASTTKIITAYFVLEKTEDLTKVVEISKEAVGVEGTSIGLVEGEHLTIEELLYGLMLRSGNDAAVALAIETCGSVKNFVEEVNLFLKEKGLKNTQLMNPHGLPDDSHYTTASDLAKISSYAMQNENFVKIVSSKEKKISNELKSKYSRNLINKNKLLKNFEYSNGIKTGFTRKAGRCFVGSATKNGMTLICVLLNCNPMFEECEKLLLKGFEEYGLYKLISNKDKFATIEVDKSEVEKLDVFYRNNFVYPLMREELKDINLVKHYEKKLSAPIKKGEVVGDVEIRLRNQLIFSEKIYNIKDVKSNTFGSEFQRVIEKM